MKHKFSLLSATFGLLVSLRDLKISASSASAQRASAGKSVYNLLRILMSVLKLKMLKFPINQFQAGLLGLATALLGLTNKLNSC